MVPNMKKEGKKEKSPSRGTMQTWRLHLYRDVRERSQQLRNMELLCEIAGPRKQML